MSELPTYVLEREFDAPREMVWRTWTEPELLARWYGPGAETIIHELNVTPGGLWLNEMKWGGKSNYERVEYTKVDPPALLVWLHSTANSEWEASANSMMPDWPLVLLTTVTFTEKDGKTQLRLTWQPHEASAAELACFAAAIGGMDKGWASGMEILAELLVELQD
ncbi:MULTISPECIES: SRPBCC family protein [Parasedimentitalea]|uniref:SRPBCC domain-containing protein n=2 Tax=Parasedimentitalea TaxID=2738399 RepID=A0A6L6WAT2_9RHOB|nr:MULTISPECIES: SRPBCC domain-containing protein [Zongyanglinia]KAE9632837.1 SRPBCC domain-containing protein [Zongyanglinia marina]MVO14913.1 SRPBCC domain-containing protein [Zongyanglinia huanghaiensis]